MQCLLQDGKVLETDIVPDDTRVHVKKALRSILDALGEQAAIEVVFTDDWDKDRKGISEVWEDYPMLTVSSNYPICQSLISLL